MLKRWLLAVLVFAVSGTFSAQAADLYGEGYNYGTGDAGYEDDYYSRRSDGPLYPYAVEKGGRTSAEDRQHSWKDAPYEKGYANKRYQAPPPHAHYDTDRQCIPRRAVRRQLRRDGWVGFERVSLRGDVVTLCARREDSGLQYELSIDRCSGELISARPLNRGNQRLWRGFGERASRADLF